MENMNAKHPDHAGAERGGAGDASRSVSPKALTASPVFHLALIALVGLIAYSNSFGVPFVIDDEGSILENPVVKNLYSFLFEGAGYRYNPRRLVGYLSFALNYRIGGEAVAGYHVVNLAVHLANASLLYGLLRLTFATPLFKRPALAQGADPFVLGFYARFVPLFAALLFVSHPIQTQAVTYVVQRLASLATLFYLACICCYLAGRLRQEAAGTPLGGRAPLFYLAAGLAAGLALFTKEISFTLPAVLLLYELSFFGAPGKKLFRLALAAAALALAVLAWFWLAGGGGAQLLSRVDALTRETDSISRSAYLFTQFSVLVTYLRLVLFPAGQNLDYDYPVYESFFTPRVSFSFLLLGALLLLALYLYRGRARGGGAPDPWLRLAGFGILWFFVTISIESGLVPIRDVIFEHRLYLPSVGLFATLSVLALRLLRSFSQRAALRVGGAAVALLAVLTWQRNQVWGSSIELWRDCAAKSPAKLRPRNNLANALMAKGRVAEAVEQLKIALEIAPQDGATIRNLGAASERLGEPDQAIALYQEALRANPLDKYARYNLGIAYSGKGLLAPAIEQFQGALAIDPGYAQAHNNLGVAYAGTGELPRAIAEFRQAARLDPGLVDAHLNLGRALGGGGDAGAALEALGEAQALQPGNAEVYNAMGIVYAGIGRRDEAAVQFRKASQLRPEDPRYTENLYRLQLNGG